jgi:CheY-like chemotaxis protein
MREMGSREERILLVEDEEPIRDLVATALRFTGFTVETAASGPEALALARNDAWHLLVLDVNLPGIDGFSLCARPAMRCPSSFSPRATIPPTCAQGSPAAATTT